MSKTKLIFVGGFLGAGKTTLLHEVSRRVISRGTRVALITNDQAPDLVDTALLEHSGITVSEVTGSCFCCDFKALRRAIDKVGQGQKPEIVLAEPVGSCTDLSATLINPMKDIMRSEVSVSPLTVLADPGRLKVILEGGKTDMHPSAVYIIKKQLEESDIIAITKTDLYPPDEINWLTERLKSIYPECEIRALSAKTGNGIDDWLESVVNGKDAGKRLLDIDYDIYAEGEAILGWLNCAVSLKGNEVNWDTFTRSLMQYLASEFDKKNSTIGHVKMMVENGDKYVVGNLTGRSETLSFRWSAGTGNEAEMIMNARVEMTPEDLEKTFLNALGTISNNHLTFKIKRLRSISPGYPNPTHRYQGN